MFKIFRLKWAATIFLGTIADSFKSRRSNKTLEKMNLIANVKTLTDKCHLIDDEKKIKEVNSEIKRLLGGIREHLDSVNKGLYLTPKEEKSKPKRKADIKPGSKSVSVKENSNNLNPVKLSVPKHPYSGRFGHTAEMMRQQYKVKLSLADIERFPEAEAKKTKVQVHATIDQEVQFIGSTKSIEKRRVNAKLNDIIRDELRSAEAYLSDLTMNLAQWKLHQQFPQVKGFEDTEFSLPTSKSSFSSMKCDFIQILHVDDHWVTIASFKEDEVNYYDSLFKGVIKDQVRRNIATICKSSKPNIRIRVIPCQQQQNSVDCGLFAVAVATDLAFGIDPSANSFDPSLMRGHLLQCFEDDRLTPFPVIKKRFKICCSKMITCDIYCYCRDVYLDDDIQSSENFMANCSNCDEWYHRKCVKDGIPITVFKDDDEAKKWSCPSCKK